MMRSQGQRVIIYAVSAIIQLYSAKGDLRTYSIMITIWCLNIMKLYGNVRFENRFLDNRILFLEIKLRYRIELSSKIHPQDPRVLLRWARKVWHQLASVSVYCQVFALLWHENFGCSIVL